MPWLGVEPWLDPIPSGPPLSNALARHRAWPRSRDSVVVPASFLRLPSVSMPIGRPERGRYAPVSGTDFVAAGLVIAALTIASPVFATADTHVVHPGESIQAAVDAASPGDTIVVTPGTYRESVRIGTDGLTLRAHGPVTLKPPRYSIAGAICPSTSGFVSCLPTSTRTRLPMLGTAFATSPSRGFRVVGFEGIGVFGSALKI